MREGSGVLQETWQKGDHRRLREALRAHYEAEARSYSVQAGKQVLEQDEHPTK